MQDVPLLAGDERVTSRLVDQLQNAVRTIRTLFVRKVHARVKMPQQPSRENRDLETWCAVARDRPVQGEVKRAFTVGAAARELLPPERLDERIGYSLAGAVEHLALDPDRVTRFAGGCTGDLLDRVRVIFERQSKTKKWPDGLRRRR